MGCLLEILFLPFEYLFELIFGGWFSAMQWIVPNKAGNKIFKFILKCIIALFSVILLAFFLIGVFIAIFSELTVFDLWKLIFIPLGISLVQILIGAIVKVSNEKKDQDS